MRRINEGLIEKDSIEKEAGTSIPDLPAEDVGEQSEQIISEADEQIENVLNEQLFDDNSNSESLDSPSPAIPNSEEDVVGQMEEHNEDENEKAYRQHGKNLNEGKIGVSTYAAGDAAGRSVPPVGTQTVPSKSQNMPQSEAKGWMENLELILDIPLQIDIQLGQTKMPLKEVLELSSGSIIKLNKSESDPVELLINGKLVAEGQIIVTDGNSLGIQVSSIINRVERIRSLK